MAYFHNFMINPSPPSFLLCTILKCIYFWIYNVHVQDVDQNHFWTCNEFAHGSAMYADSILSIRDFTFSKNDRNIIHNATYNEYGASLMQSKLNIFYA